MIVCYPIKEIDGIAALDGIAAFECEITDYYSRRLLY
jgi:hypothetical protein